MREEGEGDGGRTGEESHFRRKGACVRGGRGGRERERKTERERERNGCVRSERWAEQDGWSCVKRGGKSSRGEKKVEMRHTDR